MPFKCQNMEMWKWERNLWFENLKMKDADAESKTNTIKFNRWQENSNHKKYA
jgi:hypothetical protein